MNKELRIVHVNTENGFRGGEVQTLHLMRGLRERGHHNLLVAQRNSPLIERARTAGILVKELRMRGEWDLLAIRELRKIIRANSPDLMHAHTGHALSLALLARLGVDDLPVVCSRRLSFPLEQNPLTRKKHHSVNAIIAVSDTVRKQLIQDGIPEEKIYVAESGTDFSRLDQAVARNTARQELNLPPEAFVIGNISHFDSNKGQELLILAFLEFAARHSNEPSYLLLVGDGPALPGCRSLAMESKFAERILFTGQRDDVENLYVAMDLFFLSSLRGEGWSGVLREAMGIGLPAIAVEQPAVRDQLQDGETGIVVSNQISQWVEAIEKLFRERELRQRIGMQAKMHARHFTVDAMVVKTEACYYSVLHRTSKQGP